MMKNDDQKPESKPKLDDKQAPESPITAPISNPRLNPMRYRPETSVPVPSVFDDDLSVKFRKNFVTAMVTGTFSYTLLAPLNRIHLVMQTNSVNARGFPRYSGPYDCAKQLVRTEGLASLWRGNLAGILRHYPSAALTLGLKDVYKAILSSALTPESHTKNRTEINFLNGAAAGVTSVTLFYPLEVAEIRMSSNLRSDQLRSPMDVLSRIYRTRGLMGLYNGYGASLRKTIVHSGIYFGLFDSYKDQLFEGMTPGPATDHPWWYNLFAAQSASVIAGVASYPFDTIRKHTILESRFKKPRFEGFFDCCAHILMKNKGFYAGFTANTLKIVGEGLSLYLYDALKEYLKNKK